jgi:mannose/cellobiose epimerase-like protein (N-acyl-D-glucosamine 2-epimerase family)
MTPAENPTARTCAAAVGSAAETAERWLMAEAAPLWSRTGRRPNGLFAERIRLDGTPDEVPHRVFVQARHIYAFSQIGRLGWNGPWAELCTETMDLLLARARRKDGFYIASLDAQGDVADGRADLYVQAFLLFALAHAGQALDRPALFDEAERLTDLLDRLWAHPNGGYREGEIADPSIRRQNPHMHLLEAFLALASASGRARFLDAAATMAQLARTHFIDETTGALREYFDHDWHPAAGLAGKLVEPGHCFEWAWLFVRMVDAGWTGADRLADRLIDFASRTGIDPARDVAMNEVLLDGSTHNPHARLWPQTERLKAHVARYRRTATAADANSIASAARGLERYLKVDMGGLWRDKQHPNGQWIDEPAPGSSLYHITCGYAELLHLHRSSGAQTVF